MKTKQLFNNVILILAIVGLVGLNAKSAFSQQVKKKIVRIIENDGNGEKIVKEYDITNNKQKYDSISHDVHKKMIIERKKIDSLERVLMISLPNHPEIPPMPDMPEIPDLYIDVPDAPFFNDENAFDLDFFTDDSEKSDAKVYYSEKNLEKSGTLDKILEDLENGSFNPQKWSMKEVEKDKIKDFKTNGKGEVIVLNNRSITSRHFRENNFNPHRNAGRNHLKVRKGRQGDRLIYIDGDSLSKKDIEAYSFFSSGESNEEGSNKIIMKRNAEWDGKHSINGHHMAFYSFDSDKDTIEDEISKSFSFESSDDSDEPNCEKVFVVASDDHKHNLLTKNVNDKRKIILIDNGKTIVFEFTNPSAEDLKMLEKSSLLKEDKAKLLSPISLMLLPKKDKDKYTISFKDKDTGNVKVIIVDDKGKTIKTEELEHSKAKTEKEIEIKDLKSGVYFIQAQLNGKTTTIKLEIEKE